MSAELVLRPAMGSWDDAYRSVPPWDIGQAQPEFVNLVRKGELRRGHVLDVGCGTGENAIFLALSGFTVTGLDLAREAILEARAKASSRHVVNVYFHIGNVLSMEFKDGEFQNIIDSGLFHTFSDKDRTIYSREVARVLSPGGKYFMLCFSEKEPVDWGGPRRVTKREIEEALSSFFRVNYIQDALFSTRIHDAGGRAYLTSATRLG